MRLPGALARQMELEEGSTVAFAPERGQFIVRPYFASRKRKRYTMLQLVDLMNKKNKHSLVSWGEPVGCEVW